MQDLQNVFDYRATLLGSIYVGETAVGAPVDTLGFSQVLALLTSGCVGGTDGAYTLLSVKIQESATATAIGTGWTDIDDGQVNGTMEFADVGHQAGTNDVIDNQSIYEKVGDGVRKRYVRAHASLAGTAGGQPRYSVGILLGAPMDTIHYIQSPTSQATGNTEFTTGL